MVSKILSNLKKHGFAKNDEDVLLGDEVAVLSKIVSSLFKEQENVDTITANCPIIIDLAGKNNRVDELLEKTINHPSVKSVLDSVLGSHYKIWQAVARRSEPDDKGLSLHQDSPGETNLAILLSDNMSGDGATAFLSGSHKLPRWAKWISWSSPRNVKPWVNALTGQAGNVAFFFNRTWHTRLLNKTKQSHDVILISFFPQGASYKPMPGIYPVLQKLKGLKFGELLNPEFGTEKIDNERIRVSLDAINRNNSPYSMHLETGAMKNLDVKIFFIYIKVLLLEIFYRPLRIFYRVVCLLK